MTFYSDMASVANDLLTEFGADVILLRSTPGTFDRVTGAETGATTAEITATGIQQSYKADLIDGTRIKHGDRLYVIDDTQTPAMTDKVKVGSDYWSIVNIDETNPAGTVIVYFIQVRK